jgi:hypothetical protein
VDVIPPLAMISFDQLQPGDLFLYMTGSHKFYALKTVRPANGPAYTMVTLGPSFFEDANESILLPWDDAATVLFVWQEFLDFAANGSARVVVERRLSEAGLLGRRRRKLLYLRKWWIISRAIQSLLC